MAGSNLTWHQGEIDRKTRRAHYGHRGVALWFTGLSGSGKSTIAHRVERLLAEREMFAYVLDGDNIRIGLNSDLSFSAEDRKENIRRIGEVARLFADAGAIVLSAFISPYRADRAQVRSLFEAGDFIEIHVATPLEICEARDPKQLYKQARAGKITDFTGVNAPYEAPEHPELVISTEHDSVDVCAQKVIQYLERGGYLSADKT